MISGTHTHTRFELAFLCLLDTCSDIKKEEKRKFIGMLHAHTNIEREREEKEETS
jgi:hypothetical protein